MITSLSSLLLPHFFYIVGTGVRSLQNLSPSAQSAKSTNALCVVDKYKLFEVICELSLGLDKKKERRKKGDEGSASF
jgi:hypothetical protein